VAAGLIHLRRRAVISVLFMEKHLNRF